MTALAAELGGALTRLLRGAKTVTTFAGGAEAGGALWKAMGPVGKASTVAMGADAVNKLAVQPVAQGIMDAIDGGRRMRAAVDAESMVRSRATYEALRRERIRRDMAVNTARLAATEPDVYAQLVAGQAMPEGSMMIGGEPEYDLVNEVALLMSEGAFRQQQQQGVIQ